MLLLTGVLLRLPYHFFFPQQLAAYQEYPTLIFAAYSFFLAGNILLSLAVFTLIQLIGLRKPNWAISGGIMVSLGLFARTFHAGIDHLAFQLVPINNLELATKTVASSYGAYHIVSALSPFILFGWVVLAIGAYISGVLRIVPSLALGLMALLMIGVLKGSSATSVVATTGLCVAFIPLGLKVISNGPQPKLVTVVKWTVFLIVLLIILYFLGQAG
ncbi:hypothetical protein HUW48_07000 [Adhaeribacter radiodurans]|uniref:Uncharacterized protein n=1 Tax=Adhaeribacter radiodurans TaxID=2745197 RepID=A0A7L7LFK9_9BACT|nr:hypothetical protein HUW48_07000 [Adhaeribacter radiodurans]